MGIKEYLLPGVKTLNLEIFQDERGFFSEVLRLDWQDFFEGDNIVQSNLSMGYPGIIRAWHRHLRGQADYFLVLKGSLKINAYDDRPGSPTKGNLVEIIASEHKLQLVRIPGFYWHGSKTVSKKPSLMVYFVNRLYDYRNPDEERRPWNDPAIIDPVSGEPYDWNKLPHK